MVELIWRNFATVPGALPWAWGTLRPLYADAALAVEAGLLRIQPTLPLLPFPPELLVAVDLAEGDVTSIRNILAANDQTNTMTLLAHSVPRQWLEGRRSFFATHTVVGRAAQAPEAFTPIPLAPLPSLSELRESVVNLLLMLNECGTRRESPIPARTYRHLAYWPQYLALSRVVIAPPDADDTLRRAIAELRVKAQVQAPRLATRRREPSLDGATGATVRAALDVFAHDVLVKMVVICAFLRRLTGFQTE